jgi:hypothetical protein
VQVAGLTDAGEAGGVDAKGFREQNDEIWRRRKGRACQIRTFAPVTSERDPPWAFTTQSHARTHSACQWTMLRNVALFRSLPKAPYFTTYRHFATRRGGDATDEQLDAARKWLKKLDPDTIPRNICDISFSRSSGPGGQNVNKYSSLPSPPQSQPISHRDIESLQKPPSASRSPHFSRTSHPSFTHT